MFFEHLTIEGKIDMDDDKGIYLRRVSDDPINIEEMWQRLNEIAREYGYKIGGHGDWIAFVKSACEEGEYIKELMRIHEP